MKLNIEVVRPQIAMVLDINPEEVLLTTPLRENEKWDSFAILAAVALVTKYSGKQVTIDDMKKINTVSDLVELLQVERA